METTKFLSGISHELKFWKGFVQTPRFLDGWVGNHKTPELNDFVYNIIRDYITPNTKVLDVGSGVVSILNGTVPKDNLTTADPLGELYEVVFDYQKYGIKSPVPFPAEELPYVEQFDIVHMSNAIDHAQKPLLAIEKLYLACKPGGLFILQGFENEGTFEKWEGFHQWDISYDNNVLKIKNKEGNTDYVDQFFYKTLTSTKINFESKTWYIWVIRK